MNSITDWGHDQEEGRSPPGSRGRRRPRAPGDRRAPGCPPGRGSAVQKTNRWGGDAGLGSVPRCLLAIGRVRSRLEQPAPLLIVGARSASGPGESPGRPRRGRRSDTGGPDMVEVVGPDTVETPTALDRIGLNDECRGCGDPRRSGRSVRRTVLAPTRLGELTGGTARGPSSMKAWVASTRKPSTWYSCEPVAGVGDEERPDMLGSGATEVDRRPPGWSRWAGLTYCPG